jgi:hypothetical protein
VQPLGIPRMISMLSSLGEVPAEIAFGFAIGNNARMRALDCGRCLTNRYWPHIEFPCTFPQSVA